MNELSLKTLYGAAIRPFLPEVARLRIEVFREWPYLYDGDLDYEARYLEVYAQSASAVLVLVRDGERIVGASTGIPLAEESEPFRQPFIEAGIPRRRCSTAANRCFSPLTAAAASTGTFSRSARPMPAPSGVSAGALSLPSSAIPTIPDALRRTDRSIPPGKRPDTARRPICACSLAGRSSVRMASG